MAEKRLNFLKGDLLIVKVLEKYANKGYFCMANYGHNEGIDVLVFDTKTGRLSKVIECKNYAIATKKGKREYVDDVTFDKDVDRLNDCDILPDVEKEFVVSYESILSRTQKDYLKAHNIKVTELGYQVLEE